MRAVRIGLTGPIGCGKSTVARWLAEQGAVTVDADALAREVVEPGEPALEAVAERFGTGVLAAGGRLDRGALGRIVFSDATALADLEAIVHPAVRPRIEAAVAAAEAEGAPAIVVEAIKLVEAGYAAACDEVWLVVCDDAVQRQRVHERGLSPEATEQRIATQRGALVRLRSAATRVIDTSGPPERTRGAVVAAFTEVLADPR